MTVKVSIDQRKCMASGRCIDILPEVFRQGDDGLAELTGNIPSNADLGMLQAAAAACPSAAISIEEDADPRSAS